MTSGRVWLLVAAVTVGAAASVWTVTRTDPPTETTSTTSVTGTTPEPCTTLWATVDRMSVYTTDFRDRVATIRSSLDTFTAEDLAAAWNTVQGQFSDMVPYIKTFNDATDRCAATSTGCAAAVESAQAWWREVSAAQSFVGLLKGETYNRVWHVSNPATDTKLEHLFVRWDGIVADYQHLWDQTVQNRQFCPLQHP